MQSGGGERPSVLLKTRGGASRKQLGAQHLSPPLRSWPGWLWSYAAPSCCAVHIASCHTIGLFTAALRHAGTQNSRAALFRASSSSPSGGPGSRRQGGAKGLHVGWRQTLARGIVAGQQHIEWHAGQAADGGLPLLRVAAAWAGRAGPWWAAIVAALPALSALRRADRMGRRCASRQAAAAAAALTGAWGRGRME